MDGWTDGWMDQQDDVLQNSKFAASEFAESHYTNTMTRKYATMLE